ncbi:MAG: hypothetical protein IT378_26780 [Sandaracinaceae bacterium]|nr:hypothetical protein [Sandaracinaceae bacterium]
MRLVLLTTLLLGCNGPVPSSRGTPYDQPPLPACAAADVDRCRACMGTPATEWCEPVLEEHLDSGAHCDWILATPPPMGDGGASDGGVSAPSHAEALCALTELSIPSVASCYAQAPFCPRITVSPTLSSAGEIGRILSIPECASALRGCARSRARPDPCAGLSGGAGTVCRLTSCAAGGGSSRPSSAFACTLVIACLARRRRRRE